MVFLFILGVIILSLLFSKIRIEIINFRFSSMTPKHINQKYTIRIKLCILGKIPIIKINITENKLKKLNLKEKIKNINIKMLEKNRQFDRRILKAIKQLNVVIQKINLKIEIGTENASLTSLLVPILSTLLSIIFQRKVKNHENQVFKINPIYTNQNLIHIAISSIFEIKMIHIITIIYILNKKEGVKKYERTSNRRAYGYSYE